MKKFLFLFLFIYFSPVNASPVSFDFTHDGFELGATVTGSFSGEDLNENGKLEAEFGEIYVFEMYFSGNASVTTFSLELADSSVFDFTYDLDGEGLSETDFNGILIVTNNGLINYQAYFTPNTIGSSGVTDTQLDEGGVSLSPQIVHTSSRPVSVADEIKKRANQDDRFYISLEHTSGENLEWHSNWELRWLDFAFTITLNQRIVRVFHITNKQDPSEKYTVFYDPDTEKWTEWTRI